jgi:hydroxymethylpyrimidine/phosphomethylpyrimidine kinase
VLKCAAQFRLSLNIPSPIVSHDRRNTCHEELVVLRFLQIVFVAGGNGDKVLTHVSAKGVLAFRENTSRRNVLGTGCRLAAVIAALPFHVVQIRVTISSLPQA